MKKDFPYQIRHINIRCLLHQDFTLSIIEDEYRVYWWNNVPLAHCWMKKEKEINSLSHHVWTNISDTIQFYFNKKNKTGFEQLSLYWEKEQWAPCIAMLEALFYNDYKLPFSSSVSLVICTRNRTEQLKACLDSLSFLSCQPTEVIVIDNAPDDDKTKQLTDQYPGIKYVLEPQKGLDIARNTGWRHASSSIVAYTDDDVRLHKDWVWQIALAFDNPRVKAVTGLVFPEKLDTEAQVIFEKHWAFNRGYRDIYYDPDYFKARLRKGVPAWNVGAGANMAFRRSILEATGGFDPRLDVGASGCNGDSEMWYRLMAESWTIHYSPRAIAYHTHRREKKTLKKQIYFYLRGAASSLLVQHQRYQHKGNLYHLYKTLPAYYAASFVIRIRHPFAKRYRTLFNEVKGSLAGIIYFYNHKKQIRVTDQKKITGDIKEHPLISVIITTYNHAQYLSDAIESVLKQTYTNTEIIVIDDGSTDNTVEIVSLYPQIKYIKQRNKGLPATRNTGIFTSKGDFLAFLDADDLLYPHAIAKNLKYFHQHPECAFVSGWHDRIDKNKKLITTYENAAPQKAHHSALLHGNYIGMHAAVMYRREIFDLYLFDETLPVCEDYDLYLRITKKYSVFSHNEKLAAYRIHDQNMSNNMSLMLDHALKVLEKNYDPESKKDYLTGRKNWKQYYAREAFRRMAYPYLYPRYHRNSSDSLLAISVLPKEMIKLYLFKIGDVIKRTIKKRVPSKRTIHLGDLRRTTPISKAFGYDRGGPVDRYYIENFLNESNNLIKGRVLEIGDNAYTTAYGGKKVTKSDIWYIDDSNPYATIIGDLSQAENIASEQFDCIILTQTLHLIYDFKAALKNCHRLLKSGGTLLLTVPGITQIDYGEWGDTWYWSFTGKAIQKLLSEYFDPQNIQVQTYGNVLAATAFLYGMGKEEISDTEKDDHDPHYQVIIAARATKK